MRTGVLIAEDERLLQRLKITWRHLQRKLRIFCEKTVIMHIEWWLKIGANLLEWMETNAPGRWSRRTTNIQSTWLPVRIFGTHERTERRATRGKISAGEYAIDSSGLSSVV